MKQGYWKLSALAQWRRLLRALHRDAGYLAVGLTIVYAVSGLAVNHIADWDPNFRNIDESRPLPTQLELRFSPDTPEQNQIAARSVLHVMGIEDAPKEVYAASERELDITLERSDVHVDLDNRRMVRTGQEERFLVKTANFLHLNRGKKAWTWIADGYAILLLTLATSGLFMVKGRMGLLGRGGLLVIVGASIPIIYVVLSAP